MATFSYTKGYSDGATLSASHLTTILDEIETFLNTTKLNSDNLQTDSISSEHIKAGEISVGLLTSDCIETQNIKDGAITKVKQEAVTVTNDGTDPGVGGCVFTADSGSFDINTGTITATTNLSSTLTTNGRPVMVGLVSKSSTSSYIGWINGGRDSGLTQTGWSVDDSFRLYFYRDATLIATYEGYGDIGHSDLATGATWGGDLFISVPPPLTIDTPAAGTYTYSVKARGESYSENPTVFQDALAHGAWVYELELAAYEL